MGTNPFESPSEFPAQPTGAQPPGQGDGLPITGFVLGLVGLAAWCLPFAGIGTSILGLALSAKGLSSERRGLAIAGLALNCVALVLSAMREYIGEWLLSRLLHGIDIRP